MDSKLSIILLALVMFSYEGCGVRLGAFNIQVLGTTKMKKADVVEILVDTIGRYDLLLIQEIRDSTGTAIDDLLEEVNTKFSDNPFTLTISPRLGRTNSKEQYAFLFREKSGITLLDYHVYNDTAVNTEATDYDIFEREPIVALFQSTTTTIKKFALIGIHVAPSDAVKELQALEVVFAQTKARLNIDDVMVLGDLNADCSYVANKYWVDIPIKNDPDYTWWIGDDIDTTVGNTNCAYDRFISTGDLLKASVEDGSASIFKYDDAFKLNQTMALKVSDHYPIEMILKGDTSGSSIPCMNNYCIFGLVLCTILSIVLG
ncbi:hypothetical protein ACF0H5_000781 [Mactra antiquata]